MVNPAHIRVGPFIKVPYDQYYILVMLRNTLRNQKEQLAQITAPFVIFPFFLSKEIK
jgi:hypothetical protein